MRGAQMIPLGVAAPFTTGATPPTKNNRYFGDGYLWANISDLGPRYLERTAKSVTQAGYESAPFGPIAEPGDLLFSFKLSVGTVSIAAEKMLTNEAIATFRPGSHLDMGYAYYILPIYLLRAAGHNIYGAPMLNDSIMRRTRVPVPDLDIQRVIADYLDRETGEIDAMIAKMDELAETLEMRSSKAVAEYLESQCESAPMIPLGVASPFTTGATPPTKNGNYYGEGFAWANISDLGPKTIDKTAKSITPEGFAAASFGPCAQPGDLLFSFKLSVGTVSIAAAPMLTNEAIATFRPNGSLDMRFAYYMLPLYLRKAANVNIYGAPLLNAGIMNRARVPVPLRDEQRRIADHLNEVTDKTDAMLAKVAELKSLLIERRAALITEVVTGRKKVA